MTKYLSALTPEKVYDVLAYGAKADGSTDDTAAIQAALNAAYTAGGGRVQLPTGTCIIDPNPGLQVKTNVALQGTGDGSTLKLKASSTHNDNLVKSESWVNVTMRDFTIDGNRTNQAGTAGSYTYTQYGVYFGATNNSLVSNVNVKNTTGVGIHIYNSTGVTVDSCTSTGNNYHGYEFEQTTGCHLIGSRGGSNLLHGVLTSPGEVSGTGSKGNSFIGNTFDSNGNYGIATNAANADVSAWLNEGNIYDGNTVISNSYYGINFYKQDKHVVTNNYVALNGYFGLYAFESANNTIANNTFVGNSQATNGGYDEIMLEGYTSNSSHGSTGNNISGNTIIIQGTNKARYGINEASSGDGSNNIVGNSIPNAGTSGRLNIQSTASSVIDRLNGIGVAANATLSGAQMGLDAPFGTAALRVYNNNSGGNLQFVAPNGSADWYLGGNNVLSVTSSYATLHGYPIQAVADPTNAQDAATKNYVDNKAYVPTSRTVNGHALTANVSVTATDVGLGNVDNTSNATERAATRTLTNARINPRINTTTSSATPAINVDTTDQFNITALATNITSMTSGLSGTPVDGQKLLIRIKGAAAQTISWGTSFTSSGTATLLATTAAGKTHLIGLIYDSATAKWVCQAVDATGY